MRQQKIVRRTVMTLIGCLGVSFTLSGQQQVTEGTMQRANGAHVYSVSGSVGYTSVPPSLTAIDNYSSTVVYSSMVTGYSRSSERGRFSTIYTPSFIGHFTSSGVNSFNQNLVIEGARLLTPKLTLSVSAAGDDSTLEQLLVQAGPLALLVGNQPTFDQLTAGAGLDAAGNPAMRSVYYGSRTLSFTGQVGLNYRHSSRLSYDFRGHVTQAQTSPNGQQTSQALINRTLMTQGDFAIAYMLTPQSSIGSQTQLMSVRSSISSYQILTTTASYNHNFSNRWFATVAGGPGVVRGLGNQSVQAPTTQDRISFVGSGALGTSYNRNTLVAIYSRTMGDPYGFGSTATRSLIGAWSWYQRGMTWGMFASGGQYTMTGSSLGNTSTWQINGGISRSLSRQFQLSATYAYLVNSLPPTYATSTTSPHTARVTLTWVPSGSQPQQLQNGARP